MRADNKLFECGTFNFGFTAKQTLGCAIIASLRAQLAAESKRADEACSRIAILEGELAVAAEQLMRVHPLAEVKHFGMREVGKAAKEVADLFVGMRECLEENAVDMDRLAAAEADGRWEKAIEWMSEQRYAAVEKQDFDTAMAFRNAMDYLKKNAAPSPPVAEGAK